MLKETIIIASNISETEKLKSLAAFHINSFSKRYMSTYELAKYLLQRSGVVIPYKFIANDDLCAFIYQEVRKIPYFSNFTFNDILGLIDTINDLRHYIEEDEDNIILEKLPKDKFIEKNEAIKSFYKLFKLTLKNNNLIDELGIIRYAYQYTKTFPLIDFKIYEGEKLLNYKLDMALIKKASGKDVIPSTYPNNIKIASYTKAFSQVNEIEAIINYISKNKIPFDQCLILGAEPKDYATVLTNYKDLLAIPLNIGLGDSIIETHPGKLYSLLLNWIDSRNYPEYLKRIIYDESFNLEQLKKDLNIPDSFDDINLGVSHTYYVSFESIVDSIAELRPTFDNDINKKRYDSYKRLIDKYLVNKIEEESTSRRNKEMNYIESFFKILDKGLINFISEYSIINDNADQNAFDKINKCLNYQQKYHIDDLDIRKVIFAQKVSRREIEKDKLYFTSIARGSSCLRKHLFIVGLSSASYPGENKENPILLDRDYQEFGINNASNREIENNKNIYLNLVKEASSYDINIHLSYAFYNSETLKEQNASSVVFNTYQMEYGDNKTIEDFNNEFKEKDDKKYNPKFNIVEYFENDILPLHNIGKDIANNMVVPVNDVVIPDSEDRKVKLNEEVRLKSLSASAIEQYVECPYKFYLARILGVSQPDRLDLFEVIPANDYGSLAHSLIEGLNTKKVSEDEFIATSLERFEEYFIMHPIDNDALIERNKEEFEQMMRYAYRMEKNDPGDAVLKEEDVYYTDPGTGLKVHGFPDKIVRYPDGLCNVVDYKTGKTVKHSLNNPTSLIQCILYAYILTNHPHFRYRFRGMQYRYIRNNIIVDTTTNTGKNVLSMDEYYDVLKEVLKEIKKSYDTGVFPKNVDKCSGCYHKDVCNEGRKNNGR